MPAPETLVVFLVASFLMNASPGPSTLYVLSRSVAQGRRAGVVSALGLAAGSMFHALAAALGVSALFAYSPLAYTALKLVGAGYLVFLGVRLVLSRSGTTVSVQPGNLGGGIWRLFWQGVLTEVLNPKTALFFLALLPQFIDPGLGSATPQLVVLGLLVPVTALPVDLAFALGGGVASDRLSRNPILERWLNRTAGGVLIGLGARLAFLERE